jgi:cytochrome c
MRYLKGSLLVSGLLAGMTMLVTTVPSVAAPPVDQAVLGKRIFMRCAACHVVSAAAPRKVGPHLQGIVGRKSGAAEGFNYSPAMKTTSLRWDEATLDRWLTRPASVVPGTSMVFAGLPQAADRKAVIAYLKKPVP